MPDKVEDIVRKKPEEIVFYKDSQEMKKSAPKQEKVETVQEQLESNDNLDF